MFPVGFTMAPERLAEPVDGPSDGVPAGDGDDDPRHVLCGSVPMLPDPSQRAVNRLLLVAPDGTTHHYDKIHPFSFGGETEHYRAGSSFLTVDIEGLRTSFFVCYDLRFADEFWQLATPPTAT